jgi:hypothetical protein
MSNLPDFMDNDITVIIERLEEAVRKSEELMQVNEQPPEAALGAVQGMGAVLKVHQCATLKVAQILKRKLDLLSNVPSVRDLHSLEDPVIPKSNRGARLPEPKPVLLAEAVAQDQRERKVNVK